MVLLAPAGHSASDQQACPHLFFESVESTDPSQSFGCCRRCVDDMNLVELAACVSPAGDFIDGAIAIQMVESCVGVRL